MGKQETMKYRLAQAIRECMKTTPVDRITVREIVQTCGTTRQTFYRHFTDKYDLINWYFDKLLAESFAHMGEGKTVYEGLVKKFLYIEEEHLFFAKGRGCDAKGFYNSSGFTVLAGSVVANDCTPSFSWQEKREKMVREYASFDKGVWTMDSDKTFSSPSTASDFCMGRSSNGWTLWKDKDGNTLDSVYRKQLE